MQITKATALHRKSGGAQWRDLRFGGSFLEMFVDRAKAEVLEDHIRLHILTPEKNSPASTELAEDLIDLVRAYLK